MEEKEQEKDCAKEATRKTEPDLEIGEIWKKAMFQDVVQFRVESKGSFNCSTYCFHYVQTVFYSRFPSVENYIIDIYLSFLFILPISPAFESKA